MLKIEKPIVFFDVETTGTEITKSRIVSISCYKILPDGSQEVKTMLINPGVIIPPEVTEIHGITNTMVENAPKFAQIAKSLYQFLFGSDFGGYNSDNFDIPLLAEEFNRCEIEMPDWECNFVDVLKFERIVNSHKLGETYKRYTGIELEDAHNAEADVKATHAVLMAQIAKHYPDGLTPKEIDEICQLERKRVDFAGFLYEKEGEVLWNFGKHKDKPLSTDYRYAEWVLNNDFPTQTKNTIINLLKKKKNE